MDVELKYVRMRFPKLFRPVAQGMDGQGEPKFGAAFIIEPGGENVDRLKAVMLKVAQAEWKDKGLAILNALKGEGRIPVKSGDAKPDVAGFPGNFVVNASNKIQPQLVEGTPRPVEETEGLLYDGCYVNVRLDIWAQSHAKWGRRINASLLGVQFAGHGEQLAGSRKASIEDFTPMPESAVKRGASESPAGPPADAFGGDTERAGPDAGDDGDSGFNL